MLLCSTKAELLIGLYCRFIVGLDVQDDLFRSFVDHALKPSDEQRAAEPASAIILAQPYDVDLTEGWFLVTVPLQPVKTCQHWKRGFTLRLARCIPEKEHVGRIKPLRFHPAV